MIDAYDSMTSPRAYRTLLAPVDAVEELVENSGTQFDAEVVRIFLDVLAENGEINQEDWTRLKEGDKWLRPASL